MGALLFPLASGFTLTFGLVRVVNLAHGGFYLLGGYLGLRCCASREISGWGSSRVGSASSW